MGGLVYRKVLAPTDDPTRQAGELPTPTNGADPEKPTTTGTDLAGLTHKDYLARIGARNPPSPSTSLPCTNREAISQTI